MTALPPWIPEEVAEALRSAADAHWNGKLEIHFNDGHAVEVHATRKVKIRRPSVGAPAAIRCPTAGCGKVMELRDYGALAVCSCGTKRTRAQLLLQPTPTGRVT